jgi:hypothetical protein
LLLFWVSNFALSFGRAPSWGLPAFGDDEAPIGTGEYRAALVRITTGLGSLFFPLAFVLLLFSVVLLLFFGSPFVVLFVRCAFLTRTRFKEMTVGCNCPEGGLPSTAGITSFKKVVARGHGHFLYITGVNTGNVFQEYQNMINRHAVVV